MLFLYEEPHKNLTGESSWLLLRSSPAPAWLSRRLTRDTMILFFKLLRKRVLKFKPRGVELPSSLSREEPPSPFPTLRSKAESPNICLGRGLSRQVYGEPQARPLPAQQLQEKARKPQSMQGPKRGVPRATDAFLPACPETCDTWARALVGCSAEAPPSSQPGRAAGWAGSLGGGVLGPAARAASITIQINPGQGEAAKTCWDTPSVE